MTKVSIPIKKTIYNNSINNIKDTNFENFVPTPQQENVTNIPTVDEFFEYYDILFFQIPQTGENSHNTLIEKSSEYVGLDLEVLLEQLTLLQRQNELLQKQIDTITEVK